MVLNTRQAAWIALIAIVCAAPIGAQQPARPNLRETGEMRPVLYGFALECVDCVPGERGRGRGRGGAPVVWSYRSYPHVLAVLPGSAAEQAGIRPGDVLQSIDGLSVLSDSGARRLAHAVAGERVRLVFERASKSVEVPLMLGSVAPRKPGSGPTFVGTGYMALQGGDVKLEIWSDDAMIFQDVVREDSTGGVVTLRVGTGTVIKLQIKKDSTDRLDD